MDKFMKHASIDSQNTPYDYESVMHYGPRFFSKNGKPIIVAKKPGVSLRVDLSLIAGFGKYLRMRAIILILYKKSSYQKGIYSRISVMIVKAIQYRQSWCRQTSIFYRE